MRIETQGLKNKVSKTQGLKRCLSQKKMEQGFKSLRKTLNIHFPSFSSM